MKISLKMSQSQQTTLLKSSKFTHNVDGYGCLQPVKYLINHKTQSSSRTLWTHLTSQTVAWPKIKGWTSNNMGRFWFDRSWCGCPELLKPVLTMKPKGGGDHVSMDAGRMFNTLSKCVHTASMVRSSPKHMRSTISKFKYQAYISIDVNLTILRHY